MAMPPLKKSAVVPFPVLPIAKTDVLGQRLDLLALVNALAFLDHAAEALLVPAEEEGMPSSRFFLFTHLLSFLWVYLIWG